MDITNVEDLGSAIRGKAIFDPQILNPSEVNDKMATYDFYPVLYMKDGYDTGHLADYSSVSAKKCVNYQINNNFRYIIIPARYFDGLPPVADFIKYQTDHYITPFIDEINKNEADKDVYIQLVLNVFMVKSKEYTDDLLDWITGLHGIKGVYLITEYPTDDSLFNILYLIVMDASEK